ncbi:MAG TPA: NUDIX domain-containing protein [Patescibacteria group bacterium]|nr:NUDIX domain-containing protein [Patescibacteria group bacterium]
MPHIHTGLGQYDLTASAIIIRTDFSNPKIFLHKHLLSGKWAQPGGHVELDESPWSAVLHEVAEESGYVTGQLRVLQSQNRIKNLGRDAILLPQPVCVMAYELAAHKDHFHSDMVYAFIASSEPKRKLEDDESAETDYFDRSELVALPDEVIPDNVRNVAIFVLDECFPHWEAIDADDFRLSAR